MNFLALEGIRAAARVSRHQARSRLTLRLDAAFLLLAGSAAMAAETVGHFLGIGPLAATRGSPYPIGGFEAHGLALLVGVLLWRAATSADRRMWHGVGLLTHLLLGTANLLFWRSFVALDVVAMGVVTTALHAAFVVAQAACLRLQKR